jgi:hypothetical protein
MPELTNQNEVYQAMVQTTTTFDDVLSSRQSHKTAVDSTSAYSRTVASGRCTD